MVAKTKAPPPLPAHPVGWLPWVRLVVAALLGFAVYEVLPHHHGAVIRAVVGWDLGVAVLIAWMLVMMALSTPYHMRRRAARQDLGRWVILLVVVAGALVSMAALAVIQKSLKVSPGDESLLYLAQIVLTIVLSWSLVHTVFALHYAHAYYGPADEPEDEDGLIGGLDFPSEKQPDYWDFMYFSYVVGMTCQVSDVQVCGRQMRRLTLVHGVVAFFFNTIILALTINIIASSF
jgi:uncharacterized membrane protein